MTTPQDMHRTIPGSGPGVHEMEQSVPAHSYLWKGLKEKFLKGEPKILGVVQILIALMNLSLGIIMICTTLPSHRRPHVLAYTAYPVWGAVMFIISGSLSVAAGMRTTRCLVGSSLGMNIISSVVAAAGIIITAISLSVTASHSTPIGLEKMHENDTMMVSILMGMDGIVLVLSTLEFCIAVSLSAFGCKVACCNYGNGIVFFMSLNPQVAEAVPTAPSYTGYPMRAIEQRKYPPENLSF